MTAETGLDCEWWVLVDPETDTWMRVSEADAKEFPVVECRVKTVITHAMIEAALKDNDDG